MAEHPSTAHRLLPLQGKPPGQLLIHEVYRSIQGESTFAGLPCVFVRLAVCDSRCKWCDTPHAFTQGRLRPLDDVLEEVKGYRCPLVEVTGGEPLLQPVELADWLLASGLQVRMQLQLHKYIWDPQARGV